MRNAHFLVAVVIALAVSYTLQFQAHAAPAGPLIKHITSLVKWTKATSKAPQSDGDVLQFENGYVVETVAQGNEIGVIPYKIRVSEDGELYAVDEVNSNIVKITPPLSQYSRGRLVAGSFQGLTGHVDGKPSEARFNHPKGVTMDDQGNVYVADTQNLAIRKIGDTGVVTIAGGKSNVPGYRDGPSEDAKFSNDFDVVYVRPTCSLLVVDRGNAALRQISLNKEDCDYQSSSISTADVLMVVGAVLVGYVTCVLQQGFGAALFSKTPSSQNKLKGHSTVEEATPIMVINKEEPGWPSFGQLIADLLKFGFEWLGNVFSNLMPSRLRYYGPRKGLTPLKDTLKMPEDEAAPPMVKKQYTSPIPVVETREAHTPSGVERYPEMKPPKLKSSSFKDPSLLSKHRSSKRPEYAEFYGSNEIPPYTKPKSQKERSRHRQREKSGEVGYGSVGVEQKQVENRQVDYDTPKFDHYTMRTKYKTDESFRF